MVTNYPSHPVNWWLLISSSPASFDHTLCWIVCPLLFLFPIVHYISTSVKHIVGERIHAWISRWKLVHAGEILSENFSFSFCFLRRIIFTSISPTKHNFFHSCNLMGTVGLLQAEKLKELHFFVCFFSCKTA